jgi:anti-anti-sigma factor
MGMALCGVILFAPKYRMGVNLSMMHPGFGLFDVSLTLSDHMKLTLLSIEKDGIVRVATDGNITTADFEAGAKNPLEALLGETWFNTRVLLSMEKTDYIDSSAIGWLIGSQKHFKDGGGALVVHSVQPSVKQILELLKIGRVVPLAKDEAEARSLALGDK